MMKVRQSPAAPCAGFVQLAPLPQILLVPHAVCGAHRMSSRGNLSRGWFYGAQASKCSVTSRTRWVLHHGISSLTPGQRAKLGVQITSPAAQTERCTGNHWARTWMRSGTGSPTAQTGLNHVISSVCSHSVTPNCYAWSPICLAYFWSDKNEDFCRVTVKTHNSQKSHLFGAPHFIINLQFHRIREKWHQLIIQIGLYRTKTWKTIRHLNKIVPTLAPCFLAQTCKVISYGHFLMYLKLRAKVNFI